MLIIVFGLSGSGKNYVSQILASHFDFFYCDGDALLPDSMRKAIENKTSFTQAMRDELTTGLIKSLAEQESKHENIVLAQGLYKNQNREAIAKVYPQAEFLWVEAKPEIRLARLQERNNTIDPSYAQKISSNFEEPTHPCKQVINNTDESSVIQQLVQQFPQLEKLKDKPQKKY